MSVSLLDALADVDLAPGETYRFVVKERQVILQVLPSLVSCDANVPTDDPFEHPFPVPAMRSKVALGSLPLPDPLELSADVQQEPSA